jgi:hypothetical protein
VKWVVRGFEQRFSKDYNQTYTGVYKLATWKLVLGLVAIHDLEVEQIDAITAFLNSDIDSNVFVELLPG